MVTKVTSGIKISVDTVYESRYSDPLNNRFMFSYFITIENLSDTTVQLLRRQWDIIDSIGEKTIVEGEGVVGIQPILKPGQLHQYNSGCNLKTDIGKMSGSYLMERKDTGEKFKVMIPEFLLIAPYKVN